MTTRRNFLKSSAAATAMTGLTPYFFSGVQAAQTEAASDRLQVGCIGVGGMGGSDALDFSQLADVVAVCDVDKNRADAVSNNQKIGKFRNDKKMGKPDAFQDYRKILERKDIDTVCIATVDHWHIKIAIEALQAGKNVFVQKPLTLTIEEGQLLRNAVKKYPHLTVQVASQQRSERNSFAAACLMVRKGLLGGIKRFTADIGQANPGGPFAKGTPPANLDWDMWLGQTPKVDYIPQRCHYMFRNWIEYSGGALTDWGAHNVDFAVWAMNINENSGIIRIRPFSVRMGVPYKDGYPTKDDCYNTPLDFTLLVEFENGVELIVTSDSIDGTGVLIEGTKGRVHVDRPRIKGKPMQDGVQKQITADDYKELFHGKDCFKYSGRDFTSHKENFIDCVKNGGLPVSDVVSTVQTMAVCHLCGIAARLYREIRWDTKTETILGDDQASAFLARERRKGYEIPSV
ncbi:MAG: Gfo/Idh/MocA family oxidoreductase [Planctomycetaceae bacterium]|jgi:predicted dehydrogenase|nr:Gfo/Idh/MocA family oxidoreductase [Planctomycetaceae bacterium]